MKKKILLIITGSVAAYKAIELIRELKKKSYDVTCILTKAASNFITPLLCSSISQNPTYSDIFSEEEGEKMHHINLSRKSDLIIVAPASADFIAKMSNGYADDLASATIIASDKPVIFAPAMNGQMWENPITQQNVRKLESVGLTMIEPQQDKLACGEVGIGKMANPDSIVQIIDNLLTLRNKLAGVKILMTGGATFEPIDPVRFIGNRSSGIQAIEIANSLIAAGAKLTMVKGVTNKEIINQKKFHKLICVETAQEMFNAVKENLEEKQVFIGCAAVSDFRVENYSVGKIKKSNQENIQLNLVKNPDILNFVGHHENRPKIVIGFAAESNNLTKYAMDKLVSKNCDLIVANHIDGGKIFGSQECNILLIKKNQSDILEDQTPQNLTKKQLAQEIVSIIQEMSRENKIKK